MRTNDSWRRRIAGTLSVLFPSACVNAAPAAYPGWGVPVPFSDTNASAKNFGADQEGPVCQGEPDLASTVKVIDRQNSRSGMRRA